MLLLVLILILIAFGLLVVALFSGSVLWAWVSVAVSAVAALVLVVDWLQQRTAVRVGAADPGPADGDRPDPLRDQYARSEVEPVTEILPVVPSAGGTQEGDAGPETVAAPLGGGHAGVDRDPPAEPDSAVRQKMSHKISMPTAQPSGSVERPSGATAAATPSGDSASPTVTAFGVGAAPLGTPVGDLRGSAPADWPTDLPADRDPAGAAAVPDGPGDATAVAAAPDQVASAPPDALQPADPTVREVPSTDLPPGPDPSGAEPPEEERDPAAAAIVAALSDEVLVVDEQPRYHLVGCRALAGRPVIPLAVGEAVDLGFTPCGWCAPDRTLAERHPAAAP